MRNGEVSKLTTMDAPQEKPEQSEPQWLSHEDIDKIVAAISADDLIESGLTEAEGDPTKGLKAGKAAFNSAAEFIGMSNGSPASRHIRASDVTYWTEAISAGINVNSPKQRGRKR